jgi:hypothetical protein
MSVEEGSQDGDGASAAGARARSLHQLHGIPLQLAKDGQILDVSCEMPQCYCFKGRRHFDPRLPMSDWAPMADHYPRLKAQGGHLTPENVRLAHRLCNRRDYGWRMRINAMLAKRLSLEEIAARLNAKSVPAIHGTNEWTGHLRSKGLRVVRASRRESPRNAPEPVSPADVNLLATTDESSRFSGGSR